MMKFFARYGEMQSLEAVSKQKIPRSYDEWNNIYKNSYRNERLANDCRPPRTQLPPVVLPVATVGSPEVLDTIKHTPERVFVGDDWGRLTFDQKRERECKKTFQTHRS